MDWWHFGLGLFFSLNRGPNTRCQLPMFSSDAARPAEVLQHFVCFSFHTSICNSPCLRGHTRCCSGTARWPAGWHQAESFSHRPTFLVTDTVCAEEDVRWPIAGLFEVSPVMLISMASWSEWRLEKWKPFSETLSLALMGRELVHKSVRSFWSKECRQVFKYNLWHPHPWLGSKTQYENQKR